MSNKVIMTGTLGVMTEDSIKRFVKSIKSKVPDVDFRFLYDEPQKDEVIIKEAKGAEVIVTQYQQLNANIYEKLAPELKCVIAYGIGYNCADLPSANDAGIMVGNIPDYCTDEVATHAAALILSMQKRIPNLIKWIEAGKWGGGFKAMAPKKRFAGSTIGLYGYGRIPRLVAKMMQGFDVRVIAFDPYVSADAMREDGVSHVNFEILIKESDYLSLHAPALPGTVGVINKDVFKKMKNSAVLINTARGALINPEDLYEALTTGEIDSAALDAYITEPPVGIEQKILQLPNVLSTPHVGYFSDTAFDDLIEKTTDEIARVLKEGIPKNLINPKVIEK